MFICATRLRAKHAAVVAHVDDGEPEPDVVSEARGFRRPPVLTGNLQLTASNLCGVWELLRPPDALSRRSVGAILLQPAFQAMVTDPLLRKVHGSVVQRL